MRCTQFVQVICRKTPAAFRPAIIIVAGALLASCAFVDAFSPRIYQNNLTFQDINSQEALLNIVRASRYEALSFVSVTQSNGSQTETLSAGLPTFTFGAAQTAAQRQFAFGGNSLSSGATGGYQANPLISSGFMQGMLTPITPKVLALLLGTFPRNWTYYAVIEGVKLVGYNKITKAPVTYYFRNDPENDQYEGISPNDRCPQILAKSGGFSSAFYADDNLCNFSKFSNALGLAVEFGLTSEIVLTSSNGQNANKKQTGTKTAGAAQASTSQPASSTGAQTMSTASANAGTNSPSSSQQTSASQDSTTSTPSSAGHLCWDPTLALPENRPTVLKMSNRCGAPTAAQPEFNFDFGTIMFTNVQFVFRSPYGVYRYLGQLLREHSAGRIKFYNITTFEERELNSGPFLNITQDASSDCLVAAFYNGQSYCVPRKGSNSTAIMLDILGQLKNLSTTPSDLNAAFAVRLID